MIASNFSEIPQPTVTGVAKILAKVFIDQSSIAILSNVVSKEAVADPRVPSNSPAPALVNPLVTDDTLLNLPLVQTQFVTATVTINGTDVSSELVDSLNVSWPDEGGGSCSFNLRSENPFLASTIDIEDLVTVVGTLVDSSGKTFTATIFRGRIVQYDYDPDTDTLSVDCQDLSRDVSHDTDKINQEINQVDPVITETLTASVNDQLTVSRNMNTFTDNPVFGIWEEGDSIKSTNLVERFDFVIDGFRTIRAIGPLGNIVAGRNYVIRYAVPLTAFDIPTRTKSEIVEDIAQLANITSMKNERRGKVEDEIVRVNVVANQEFPLDILRKICVPQTWKVEFDQAGDLIIRREILKATPDFTFDKSIVLENTLTITKQLDSVVNEQRVAGIVKRQGRT